MPTLGSVPIWKGSAGKIGSRSKILVAKESLVKESSTPVGRWHLLENNVWFIGWAETQEKIYYIRVCLTQIFLH